MKTNAYRSLLVSVATLSFTALLAQQPVPEVTAPLALQSSPEATTPRVQAPKEWNFMVYMCNNNNLHQFGVQNFRQMVKVGSTNSINLLLQMDEFGEKEIMRFFIERNNPIVIENQSNTLTSFSGTPANLIEFAEWGTKNYASNKIILDLWNHGAGIKDPHIWGRMLTKWRDKLFAFNHKTGLLELNRNMTQKKSLEDVLLDFEKEERGIAFNDAAETYLTNEDLKMSLDTIVKTLLNGNKIEILTMDACHMAMIEIASQVKSAAKIMIASEEVEPGAGYDYYNILQLFLNQSPDAETISKHIVECYKNEYQDTVADYTQSAIDLSYTTDMELAINKISSLLIDLISTSKSDAMKVLKAIRFNNTLATEFLDTDYIDLYHFLKSLALKGNEQSNHQKLGKFWSDTKDAAIEALTILQKMIIANASGKNLPEAYGLSIYFPATSIHSSYAQTEFARVTLWPTFLKKFLAAKKAKDAEDDAVAQAPEQALVPTPEPSVVPAPDKTIVTTTEEVVAQAPVLAATPTSEAVVPAAAQVVVPTPEQTAEQVAAPAATPTPEAVVPATEQDTNLKCSCQDGKNKTKCSCQDGKNNKRCACEDKNKKRCPCEANKKKRCPCQDGKNNKRCACDDKNKKRCSCQDGKNNKRCLSKEDINKKRCPCQNGKKKK